VGNIIGYLNNVVTHHKYHMSVSVNVLSIKIGKMFKYGAEGLNRWVLVLSDDPGWLWQGNGTCVFVQRI